MWSDTRTARALRRTVLLIAVLASLVFAGSAQATINVTSFSATPSTTQAGGHPNFTTAIRVSYSNTTDDIRSVETRLPAGMLGNPSNVGKCSLAQLNSDTCPANSKIGTTTTMARPVVGPVPLPVTNANGDVYNVTPTGNEPARIGMVIRPLDGLLGKFALSGPASVRVPGDFGLNVRFDNLPRNLPALNGLAQIPVQVLGLDLRLNGFVGSKSFMVNPTSCGTATTNLAVTSYEAATPINRSSSFTPTNCGAVPFNPTVGYQTNQRRANSPTALLAAIFVPANDVPLAQSHIRGTTSILPIGMQVNFAALAGIAQCSDAQFNIGSASPTSCPAGSKIGQTVIVSPAVGVKFGDIFMAAASPTAPLRLFITIQVTPTQTAKFVVVNQLVTAGTNLLIRADLNNLPQTPQTQFVLGFNGGPNALLKTPATCGTFFGSGIFTPWSGGPTKYNYSPIAVTARENGAAC